MGTARHGRFVLWGGWHGASLAVHKWFMAHVPGFKAQGADMPRWRRIIGIVVTFHVVCFGWIMFRASDLQTARNMLSQIFTDFKPELIPQVVSGYAAVMGLMAVGYLLHLMPVRSELWGSAHRDRVSAAGEGGDDRGTGLGRDADQVGRDPAVYLFPILIAETPKTAPVRDSKQLYPLI